MSTLGKLIATLGQMPPGAALELTGGWYPGPLSSYRGYYEDLAIEPVSKPTTVSEFLQEARAAVGKTFEGYKGGDYVMDRRTAVWVSHWGDVSEIRYAGVSFDGTTVQILTEANGDHHSQEGT